MKVRVAAAVFLLSCLGCASAQSQAIKVAALPEEGLAAPVAPVNDPQ